MPGPTPPGHLLAALAELAALGEEPDRAAVGELCDRLRESRLRVLVAGEAKRGKSTLVNALLGREVLPTGVTPLTALATTVRHGRDEEVRAAYLDGRDERLPLSALPGLVTERGNPGNRRGLASVTVSVDSPWLARGVELVDTPGTGSVYAHNTAEAQAALQAMDAAVFVLTADPPVSASERELIAKVARLSVTMLVVLNKADYLDAGGDLAEALEFTAGVVVETAGRPVRVYPMSARAALSPGGDPGFDAFTADLGSYLEASGASDLRVSAARHGRRIAGVLRDEALLSRQAAQMRTGEAAERVTAFGERLAAVAARRQDAADLAAGESARLLADLNEAAEQATRESTARALARLDELLDGDLREAAAADIERTGRANVSRSAVEAAESWRRARTARLEEGLAWLDERLADGLRAELDAVREAAAELLGLRLAVPGPGQRLTPALRFFYHPGGDAGQTELLAGALRRWLPGEAGRRRVRAHLRGEAARLVPQQIGRARADLQYRLAEATRRLARTAQARYDETTGRLERALREAASMRDAAAGDAATRDRELAGRASALEQVIAQLDAAVAEANPAMLARPPSRGGGAAGRFGRPGPAGHARHPEPSWLTGTRTDPGRAVTSPARDGSKR